MKKTLLIMAISFFLPLTVWAINPAFLQRITETGFAGCSGNYGIETTNGTEATELFSGMQRGLSIGINCGGGTITSISVYLKNCHDSSHEVIFCLYSDNSGSPESLLYQSAATYDAATNGTFGWVIVSGVNEIIGVGTTTIWLAVQFESAGGSSYQHYATAATACYENGTWNSIPDPWNETGASSHDLGAYVTF